MAVVEVNVADGHVGYGAGLVGGLGRDVVVAGTDVGIDDGEVGAAGLWVNAVRVARPLWRVDLHTPGGISICNLGGYMAVVGVTQRDAIEGEVIRTPDYYEP